MLKPVFELNGIEIKEPINWQELSIELNFDKDDPDFRGEVSVNSWQLGLGAYKEERDGTNIANDYIKGGLIGQVGVTEGIPFKIYLDNGFSERQLVFDGMLDLFSGEIQCDIIQSNSIETGRLDWFNEVADSFTFEYLHALGTSFVSSGGQKPGAITKDDFITIPYLLSSVPDTFKAAVIVLSFYAVIQDLLGIIADILASSSAVATTGGLQFGSVASTIVYILRITLLIVTALKLIINLYFALIGVVKYHEGMYILDMCKKGAEYLGLEFKSTIIEKFPYNQWVILPEKYNLYEPDKGGLSLDSIAASVLGVTNLSLSKQKNVGYYKGTYGDLLRELKKMFNAKVVIKDGIIRLERRDYNDSSDLFVIPDVDRSEIPYRFNVNDLKSFYSISFSPDLDDKNVWQSYVGTEIQIVTSPKLVNNVRNVLTKGEERVDIGFARGKRKEELTLVEKIFDLYLTYMATLLTPFEKSINAVIKAVNKVTEIVSKIVKALKTIGIKLDINLEQIPLLNITEKLKNFMDNRLHMLLMENDFVNIPKLIMIDDSSGKNKIHSKNDFYINAIHLWNEFHYINSFVEDTDLGSSEHNQKKLYTLTNVPFCYEDYQKVRNSNKVREADGITEGELVSLKWNIYDQKADITYKVPEKYTNNLELTKILSDGR